MAGSKSNYLENALLNGVLGGPAFSLPSTVYAGLYTTAPSDGSPGVECSGSNYSRAAVPNDETHWPAAVGGVKHNGLDIIFPVATGSMGAVVGVGIFDAPSGGNLLYYAEIAPENQKTYATNDVPVIPAGAITITED